MALGSDINTLDDKEFRSYSASTSIAQTSPAVFESKGTEVGTSVPGMGMGASKGQGNSR